MIGKVLFAVFFFLMGQLCLNPVSLSPGANIQAAVTTNPAGTTFSLAPGIYRQQSVVPKAGDTFIGQAGAIMDGAALTSGWTFSGGLWSTTVPINTISSAVTCLAANPLCQQNQDLFLNNVLLTPVASQAAVVTGTWFLNTSTSTAYMFDNPIGQTVEISATQFAISGTAANVVINGLIIEKYCNGSQTGAVQPTSGSLAANWVIQNTEFRFNHGYGLRLANGMQVLTDHLHHNGQMGVSGGGVGILVNNSEVDHNNTAGYDWNVEAGGSKFASSVNLTATNNFYHDNIGPGIWSDIEDKNTLYDSNHTKNNLVAGILHEVSYAAVISNNLIENEGTNPTSHSPFFGAGITVANSENTEVKGNTINSSVNGIVIIQLGRGNATNGQPYLSQNDNIHNNTINPITLGNTIAGLVANDPAHVPAVFTTLGNQFQGNSYPGTSPTLTQWQWNSAANTLAQWQAFGNQ